MVKKAITKKVRAKAKPKTSRKSVVSTAKLLGEAAINAIHAKALAAAAKVAKVEERAVAAVDKLIAQKATADARVKAAAAVARTKKTTAAKNAVVKARAVKAATIASLKMAKANLKVAKADVKAAVADVTSAKKRDDLKQKAVAAFTAKWEKAYDRKTTKKRVVRRKARRVAKVKTEA